MRNTLLRVCSIADCPDPFDTSSGGVDYCASHYNRLRRHGDPLGGQPTRRRRGVFVACSFVDCDAKAKARGLCLGHYNQWFKGQELRTLRQFNFVRDGKKTCPSCSRVLDVSDFSTKGQYLKWQCRECDSIYNRARTHGITPDEVRALLAQPCAGCLRHVEGKNAHIDHDHATGKVRGLLCHWCNHALAGDVTPETLRRLADYLEAS